MFQWQGQLFCGLLKSAENAKVCRLAKEIQAAHCINVRAEPVPTPDGFPTLDARSGEIDAEGLADFDADGGVAVHARTINNRCDYLAAFQRQLQKEFSGRSVSAEPQWLRSFLKQWVGALW